MVDTFITSCSRHRVLEHAASRYCAEELKRKIREGIEEDKKQMEESEKANGEQQEEEEKEDEKQED
jgi:hypothetical protein